MRIHCYFGTFYLNKYLELYYFITGIDLMLLRNVCMLLRDALPLNEWNQLREDRNVSALFVWATAFGVVVVFAVRRRCSRLFWRHNSNSVLEIPFFFSYEIHFCHMHAITLTNCRINGTSGRKMSTPCYNIYIIHKEWQWMPTTERQSIPLFIFHLKLLDWDFTIIILPSNGMIQMKM